MIIGYARAPTTEKNLGLRHDDLKPAFDASADPTEPRHGRMLADRLAALVGRYSEAMGVAVIISDKELGLSVVAIYYLRN